jgi:hypothetical protein
VLLLLVFMLLLASRRSMQFMSPQVWDEDGTQIIRAFAEQGWPSLFLPVNGYLVTVPKLITMLSVSLSAVNYPVVSTLLAALFIGLVGVAIAMAPTKLNAKLLCALAVFVIPADPEVFALPLYTFWWASILLLLLVLWDEQTPALGWRLVFLLLGGLSSPVIAMVLPVLWLRAAVYRRQRGELVIAVVATLVTAVQVYFMVAGSAGSMPPPKSIIENIIPTFFGNFLIGNWPRANESLWIAGIGVACLALAGLVRSGTRASTWLLMYLLVGAIGLSVARVDPAILHPHWSGPRYFFFPFILLFWVLIQFAASLEGVTARRLMGGLLALSAANAVPVWSRTHDDLQWSDHLLSCQLFPRYVLPVQYDGDRNSAWELSLSGADCQALSGRALLDARAPAGRPPFAYTAYRQRPLAGQAELLSSTMNGADFAKSQIAGYRVLGSYAERGDADAGVVLLKMRRGGSILYRSGPGRRGQSLQVVGREQDFSAQLPLAADWVTLEFSNQRLPEEFTLRISDTGQGWGEWSAVAVKIE